MECSGCQRNFAFPAEQPFDYRLNSVVKNNMFQSRRTRDGNRTVIRTLALLHERARQSFGYSPQVNLYDSFYNSPDAFAYLVVIHASYLGQRLLLTCLFLTKEPPCPSCGPRSLSD